MSTFSISICQPLCLKLGYNSRPVSLKLAGYITKQIEFISTKGWFTTDLLPYSVTAEVTRQAKSHCTHSTESGHCVTFSSVPNHQSYHTKLHLHKWKGKLPCLAILGFNDPHDEKCLKWIGKFMSCVMTENHRTSILCCAYNELDTWEHAVISLSFPEVPLGSLIASSGITFKLPTDQAAFQGWSYEMPLSSAPRKLLLTQVNDSKTINDQIWDPIWPIERLANKNHLTFHYTGWFIGILILAYYNPDITG